MVSTVFAESNETLKVVPFFNSQLGGETAVIAQIARGRIEMGQFTTASVALQVPVIALAQMPLYFSSSKQRDCVFDNHLFEPVKEMLAKKNIHMIKWGEVGPIHLPGKTSFAHPDDVKGAKVGVIGQRLNNEFWQWMGANPVSMNVSEVASSLQTGLIDTNPMPYAIYVPAGINKIAPTMTKLKLWDASGIFLMNKRVYDKLPQVAQKAIEKEADMYTSARIRKETRDLDSKLSQIHQSKGGEVIEPSPEQIELWKNRLKGFYAAMVSELGDEGKEFFALMEAGKQSCAQQ